MIRLKPVIVVRELPPCCAKARAHLPSIHSLVSQEAHPDETKILRYLQQGVFGSFFPDPRLGRDVFSDPMSHPVQVPSSIPSSGVFTDGAWLWPGVLAFYVAKYHVSLDPAFVEHARARNWTINPADVRLEDLSFDSFDSLND